MQRLFSTFARGLPGAGLLLLRLVGGIGLIVHGVTPLGGGAALGAAWPYVLAAGSGVLLMAGVWTPVAGVCAAIVELSRAFAHVDDAWPGILLGTLGAALALLGPGAWSVDARRFGRKRIIVAPMHASSIASRQGESGGPR